MTSDPFNVLLKLPVKIAVSSCLLGERVRYDGNHKAHGFIIDQLSTKLELLKICPEVSIGLGIPRIPIRLQFRHDQIEAVTTSDHSYTVTDPLRQCARQYLLQHPDVSGYILKSKSPSCGIANTKIYNESGSVSCMEGSGVFASELMSTARHCLFISEDLLEHESNRLDFLIRVIALQRLHLSVTHTDSDKLADIYLENYLPLFVTMDDNKRFDGGSLRIASSKKYAGLDDCGHFQHLVGEILTIPVTRTVLSDYFLPYVEKSSNIQRKNKLLDAVNSFRQYESNWSELKSAFNYQLQTAGDYSQSDFNPCQWLIPFDIEL